MENSKCHSITIVIQNAMIKISKMRTRSKNSKRTQEASPDITRESKGQKKIPAKKPFIYRLNRLNRLT